MVRRLSPRTLICIPLAVIGLGSIAAFAETNNPVNLAVAVLCGLGTVAAIKM